MPLHRVPADQVTERVERIERGGETVTTIIADPTDTFYMLVLTAMTGETRTV